MAAGELQLIIYKERLVMACLQFFILLQMSSMFSVAVPFSFSQAFAGFAKQPIV